MYVGSLFSGIGGIELGFMQAGCDVAWAIEKETSCCKTYNYNFPGVRLLKCDIRHAKLNDLASVDILTAGFPCQPFSVAGSQRGFDDPRGNLFYQVTRFAETFHPRFIFLENVSNLMEHDKGRTFITIHNELISRGYIIRYKVLRSSEYGGVPQIRDRIYIIAFRDVRDCDKFEFPPKMKLETDIESIVKRNEKKHNIYYYCEDGKKRYERLKRIVNRRDCIYRVYHDSIKPTMNHMCPTLTASMGTQRDQVPLLLDDYGIRKLTIKECLQFQGFPHSFRFPQNITIDDAYKQIGNSVTVPVVQRIAQVLLSLS